MVWKGPGDSVEFGWILGGSQGPPLGARTQAVRVIVLSTGPRTAEHQLANPRTAARQDTRLVNS